MAGRQKKVCSSHDSLYSSVNFFIFFRFFFVEYTVITWSVAMCILYKERKVKKRWSNFEKKNGKIYTEILLNFTESEMGCALLPIYF